VAAVGIKISDPKGPVFFRQRRSGVYGRVFHMWKFRSMYVDAEARLEEVKAKYGNEMNGPIFKLTNDPRIFKFGHFIRKTSIDELPQLLNILISEDICEYIASRLKNNIRELEGAVKKMRAYYLLENQSPSFGTAQKAISDILNNDQPVPVTVTKIVEEVSRTFNVTAEDIRSKKRSANISRARQISMYCVREITQMSVVEIGDEFGGRDHSTVIYALQQVEKMIQQDSKLRASVEDIIKNIRDR
jgi:hypothetical protein